MPNYNVTLVWMEYHSGVVRIEAETDEDAENYAEVHKEEMREDLCARYVDTFGGFEDTPMINNIEEVEEDETNGSKEFKPTV